MDGLAAHRITRLLVADTITERPRSAFIRLVWQHTRGVGAAQQVQDEFPHSTWSERANEVEHPPAAATLVTCPWCMGVWVAGGVVLARAVAPRTWERVARPLALASIVGLLSARG